MNKLHLGVWSLLLLPLAPPSADHAGIAGQCGEPDTVISNVRVFDGRAVLPEATVVLRCGLISQVATGEDVVAHVAGATSVDGTGKTLLPGLIDTHVHAFKRSMLERPLDFGVTTVMDMGSTALDFARRVKGESADGSVRDRADLVSAVVWATAPGSHGTQFGEVPTLEQPEQAAAFVADRVAEGADYIKIIYDHFKMFDRPVPTLSYDTMKAIVDAAHEHDRIAVVHSRDVEAFGDVARAGADGIVHAPVDEVPDDGLIALLKANNVFVSANLSLLRPVGGTLVDDPSLGPRLSAGEAESLGQFRKLHRDGGDQVAFDAVRAMHAGGVKILAGSDAPNAGTTPGASLHLELALLVEAGLSPGEALTAATADAAEAFRLNDRGRIAEGYRADLLMVDGRPDQNILETRRIVAVWKAGAAHEPASRP